MVASIDTMSRLRQQEASTIGLRPGDSAVMEPGRPRPSDTVAFTQLL